MATIKMTAAKMILRGAALLAAALLLLPGSSPAQEEPAEEGGFNLEGHVLTVDDAPEVPEPGIDASAGSDGKLKTLAANGAVSLVGKEMALRCLNLVYDDTNKTIRALRQVQIDQMGMKAKTDDATYDLISGDVTLRGKGQEVEQDGTERRTRFSGMELFELTRLNREGDLEMLLSGPDPIKIELLDKTVASADNGERETGRAPRIATPTPRPELGNGQPSATGTLGQLGGATEITASPKDDAEPQVTANVNSKGELEEFRAKGSVRMKSDEVNMRADNMTFDGEVLIATGDVYLKKDPVEADAGRLDYNMTTGVITFSQKTDVRMRTETGVQRSTGFERIILTPKPNGEYNIQWVGTGDISFEQAPAEEKSSTPEAPRTGEIRLNEPGSLPRP